MGLLIGLLVTVVFIVLSIVGLVFFKKKLNNLTGTKFDKSELANIENTQDLLPFGDIALNRIDLGNHRYVAILQIEPFNYMIRSEEGKDAFALNLRRAYNSIPFRSYMFTHTRDMVNDNMLKNLSKTIDKTISEHPDQKEYADEYFRHLSIINVQNFETGALRKVKDYYLIIPWEPSTDHNGMSESELENIAREELKMRLISVREKMTQCGVKSDFLTTMGIISLLTSVYRREETNRADLLFSEEYQSAMVSGDMESLNVSDKTKLASILEGAIFQINQDIISKPSIEKETRERGLKSVDIMSQMAERLKDR